MLLSFLFEFIWFKFHLENALERGIKKRKGEGPQPNPTFPPPARGPKPPLPAQQTPRPASLFPSSACSLPQTRTGPALAQDPARTPSQTLVAGPRPFSHRQHGPTRQPTSSPPSFLLHRDWTGDFTEPDSPGSPCYFRAPSSYKAPTTPPRPSLLFFLRTGALADVSAGVWISLKTVLLSPSRRELLAASRPDQRR